MGYPIRVNSIHPGNVDTRMLHSIVARFVDMEFSRSVEQQVAAINAPVPLGRMGEPAEIAGAVVFLYSSASSYMAGSTVVFDGGYSS